LPMDKSFEADQAQIEQLIRAVQVEGVGTAPLAGSKQPGVLDADKYGSDNVDISRSVVHTGYVAFLLNMTGLLKQESFYIYL